MLIAKVAGPLLSRVMWALLKLLVIKILLLVSEKIILVLRKMLGGWLVVLKKVLFSSLRTSRLYVTFKIQDKLNWIYTTRKPIHLGYNS